MANKRFLGRKAQLHYATDFDSPVWTRVSTRNTLSLKRGKRLEDVTGEDSDGEEWQQAVLNQRGVEFDLFIGDAPEDDAVFAALEAAYNNDTALVFAVSYGDITGSGVKYRKLWLYVTTFDDDLGVGSVAKAKVTLTPGPCDDAPTTVTVA